MSGSTSLMSSSRRRALTSSGLRVPWTLTRSRSASTSCMVGSVPRSARRSVSSTSSQTFSSMLSPESRARRPLPRMLLDLTSRARSRLRRPSTGAGVSPGMVPVRRRRRERRSPRQGRRRRRWGRGAVDASPGAVLHKGSAACCRRLDGIVGVTRSGVRGPGLPGLQQDRHESADHHERSDNGQNYG